MFLEERHSVSRAWESGSWINRGGGGGMNESQGRRWCERKGEEERKREQ